MSRIGNRKIVIPEGVSVKEENKKVTVTGKLGELSLDLPDVIDIKIDGNEITLARSNELKTTKALHGTANANLTNMIKGVTEGFNKSLEIIGVGYRFSMKGADLVINAGYSHPVEVKVPAGLKINLDSNTEITI